MIKKRLCLKEKMNLLKKNIRLILNNIRQCLRQHLLCYKYKYILSYYIVSYDIIFSETEAPCKVYIFNLIYLLLIHKPKGIKQKRLH